MAGETEMDDGAWRGVVIEESLQTKKPLKAMEIVKSSVGYLEAENERGKFTFHKVAVPKKSLSKIVREIQQSLSPRKWYVHFVNDDEIKIVFPAKVFELKADDEEGIRRAQEYGRTLGIPREQMDFARLLANPFDE